MGAQLHSVLIGKGLHPVNVAADHVAEHAGCRCAHLVAWRLTYGPEKLCLVGECDRRWHQQSPPRRPERCAVGDCASSPSGSSAVRPSPMSLRTRGTSLADLLMTAR